MALPTITGVARLVADPELKFSQSGKAIASVRLVFNARRLNKATNEWEDGDVFYVRGTAWERLAENIAETCSKGQEVLVSGELRTESWESNGEKREAPALLIRSIGPNLSWATATVQRAASGSNARPATPPQGQATRGRQAPAEDPWATGPAAPVDPPF